MERFTMQDVYGRANELLTTDERLEFYTERNQELEEIQSMWAHILEVMQVCAQHQKVSS